MFPSLRYSTMVSFISSPTFPVTEIPSQKDSAKRQLLRLYSQLSFTKILKALHTGFNIYNVLEERLKAFLKNFSIDVDRLTLPRRPQDVIFEACFLKCISKLVFFQY